MYNAEETRKLLAARRLTKPGDMRHNSQAAQQQAQLDAEVAELTLQANRHIDAAKAMDKKLPTVDAIAQRLMDEGAIVGCDSKQQWFGTNSKNRRNIHTAYKLSLDGRLSDEVVAELKAKVEAELAPLFTEVTFNKNWYEGYEKSQTYSDGTCHASYYFTLTVYDDVPQAKRK